MAELTWIEEQKAIHGQIFSGKGGKGNDADRMLEYGKINKDSYPEQSILVITAKLLARNLGIEDFVILELTEPVEMAQMYQDAKSREDFKKVAIEQWQGKLQALKNKALLQAVTQ